MNKYILKFVMSLLLVLLVLSGSIGYSSVFAEEMPTLSVSGRVFDENNEPVAGVEVHISTGLDAANYAGYVTTDENGYYYESGLPWGAVYLRLKKDGEWISEPTWLYLPEKNVMDFYCSYSISGRITDQIGKGISLVNLYFLNGNAPVPSNPEGVSSSFSSVLTDENGYWHKDGLLGPVTVIPKKAGWDFVSPYMLVKSKSDVVNFVGSEQTVYGISTDVIGVSLDGKNLQFDQPPVNADGRVLVPIRGISEALGAAVEYTKETKTIHISGAAVEIELVIDSDEAVLNEKKVRIDVPAKIINNRTMVPLRFVGEAFGADVQWNGKTKTAVITMLSDLNSRDLKVTAVKFYEGGYEGIPYGNRAYSSEFFVKKDQYIYWELDFSHSASKSPSVLPIHAIYYYSDGRVLWESDYRHTIEGAWITSWCSDGLGYDNDNQWQTGTYTVDFLSADKKIASGSFEIK